jgi:ATP-dependent exoDNAse (exonuclease V) beta subunit
LIDALRVIAGVHQPLDLWFALKSPLFGCDDAELLAYKRLGGRWNLPFGEISEELAATRVHASLATLARIKRETSSLTPAALIQRLVEDCGVTSTYDQTPRGRFEIECVQMVMRQARSWSQAGGLAVADYLAWLKDQLDENARETLPETDDRNDDAVRISTVHGVKGLEFPIVILSGMGRVRVAKLPKISVKQNRFEFNLAQLKSVGYREVSEPIEIAEIAAEQTRILYVAATRAKDHLVVSNMAKEKADGSTTSWSGLYREAVAGTVDAGLAVKFDQFVPPSQNPTLTLRPSFAPESESWLERLPAIRAKSKAKNLVTPSTRGAKAETDAAPEDPTLVDEALQAPKNYMGDEIVGSDVAKLGNAFHKVLEAALGRRATEIDQLVQLSMQQALQEYGVPQFEERLQKMVANVFNHAVIQRIYAADHVMPELEISEINGDGVLVEGFADLVLREGDSLVVIDYKTNLQLDPEKVTGYAQQLDVYAQIIQRATQLVVKEKLLFHVLPEKAELIAV